MAFHIVNSRLTWLPESKKPKTGAILALPANDHLWMISGPGLEVKKAVGKELELEAVRLGPVAPGELVWTSGDACGYRFLAHAAVMGQDLRWQVGAGAAAAKNLLRGAAERKIDEIVTYPFYRGAHGSRLDAAREMLGAFLGAMETGIPVKSVIVLVADDEEQRFLQELFLQLLSAA